MLGDCRSLALEVERLEDVRPFYESDLHLSTVAESEDVIVYDAGSCRIELRGVGALPRGGSHVHYALTVPEREYDDWYERLEADHDLEERTFGGARSLYCYDPAGHCVELAEGGYGSGVTGMFEVVLEVANLAVATERYRSLGFSPVDPSQEDGRVRLTTGEVDLELWRPRRGIADARGGVHVHWSVAADDPDAIVSGLDDDQCQTVERDDDRGSLTVRDRDCHRLTLVQESV